MSNAVIQREIDKADVVGQFLGNDQLALTSQYVADGGKRLDAVNLIADNASFIVSDAITTMVYDNTRLLEPGGNCYPARRLAACLRDGEILLRYMCYALLAGSAEVLKERLLSTLPATYAALGVPSDALVKALERMKMASAAFIQNEVPMRQAEMRPGDCSNLAAEVATYFDIAIATFTPEK
ncbi:MAG: bleomycin hydrolase [Cyanobacteria bacterium J06642_2]